MSEVGEPVEMSGGRSSSSLATAPDWPAWLLAHRPVVTGVASGGSKVELLVWGKRGLPGLLLLHGAGAHAHWWDAVAPLLAETHRVAAMTLPGNGGSGWRDHYSSADIAEDARACVAAASLAEAGPPVFIGHSMGGAHLMHGAVHSPAMMRGLILLDTSFRAPAGGASPGRAREPVLVDHVARLALMAVAGDDGSLNWCWRADPDYWSKFARGIEQGPYTAPLRPQVPAVQIIAEHSHVAAAAASLPLGDEVPRIVLPDCGHHAMLDRPLEIATALCTLLAGWPCILS